MADKLPELEKVLLDYMARYGLTPLAEELIRTSSPYSAQIAEPVQPRLPKRSGVQENE